MYNYYVYMMFLCFSLSKDGRVIVMSIHQPRYSIFRLCDHITLLSRGSIVYTGAGRATLPYFAEVLGKIIISIQIICTYVLGLCDIRILIMHYKIISIMINILINNDRVLGIFLDFYNSEIALYTNMSVCFV